MLIQGFVTDGGAHPPEKLAYWAAQKIGDLIAIDATSQSDDARRARRELPRLLLDIQDEIEAHHHDVQIEERKLLREVGTARLSQPLDPSKHAPHAETLEDAVATVVNCAKGTVFEPHFQTEQVREAVRGVIGSWFSTAIDIERDWVAKGHTIGPDHRASENPDHDHRDPHVRAWLARRKAA
jgi:hypothetical protein